MLAKLFLLVCFWNLSDGLSVTSPRDNVLAFVRQRNNQIEVSPVPLKICADIRKCNYTVESGKCPRQREYISTVREEEGNIVCSCCQSDHKSKYSHEDDCRNVTANSMTKLEETTTLKEVEYIKAVSKTPTGTYVISVCKPRCGGDGQKADQNNGQNTPQQPPAKSAHKCFSSDTKVRTKSGTKGMDQVQVGDQVLVEAENGKLIYDSIVWLYHRDPDQWADFLTIRTASNRWLRLSKNHLIPIVPCWLRLTFSSDLEEIANKYSFFAQKLRRGHCVLVFDQKQPKVDIVLEVTNIRKQGIFSPITTRGTIVVNDFFASCYSSIENHPSQHVIHGWLIRGQRIISTVWHWIFGAELMPQQDDGIPAPLKIMLNVAQLVIPSNVYSFD